MPAVKTVCCLLWQRVRARPIEDGFLAPFKVISITTDISDGWRPLKGQRDYYGNEIEDRIYNNTDYDYNIIIQDRINQVALEITNYLISTDRMQKTIVKTTFEDTNNYMKDGVLLCQVVNVIDELDLTDYEESHAFGDIYESILKELQSAGSAGEF